MFNFVLYLLILLIIHIILVLIIFYIIRKVSLKLYIQSSKKFGKNTYGFIHPSYNDLRVNEKVLWMMIKTIMEKDFKNPEINKIFIFSSQENKQSISIQQYFKQLDLEAQSTVNNFTLQIVKIKSLAFVNSFKDSNYFFQIILQTLISVEILLKCPCYYFIDTTNLPFINFVLKLFLNCRTIGYYHCPYIESNIINYVRMKKTLKKKLNFFTNLYYYFVVRYYAINGQNIDLILFNSSITKSGILPIWNIANNFILYTPSNLRLYDEKENNITLNKQSSSRLSEQKTNRRENIIVSFSQFRSEKNHMMQIRIFQKLLEITKIKDLRMNIIGITKTIKDQEVFNNLVRVVNSLNLQNYITIERDLPKENVKHRFLTAKIGLHTQKDDISGATIIDMMCAGLIVVAHKSGAPLYDIIGVSEEKCVGILAESVENYAEQIAEILNKYHLINNLITTSKQWIQKFSHESFLYNLKTILDEFII